LNQSLPATGADYGGQTMKIFMRVGFDCREILCDTKNGTGVEHYVFCLAKVLAEAVAGEIDLQIHFFFNEEVRGGDVVQQICSHKNVKAYFIPSRVIGGIFKHKRLSDYFEGKKLDLFHFPTGSAPYFYKKDFVITVHDVAIYLHPEWFSSGQWFSTRFVFPRSIKRAKKIIAVSGATKRDLMARFKVLEYKVEVVHEGLTFSEDSVGDFRQVLSKFGICKPYILFVSTVELRKNIPSLIWAFAKFHESHPEYSLLLAGKKGLGYGESVKAVEEARLGDSVKFFGYVSLEEKKLLLKNAAAFAYPSLYEGFGLPILEAMAMGIPVVTSNTSSMPEVAGDAALLVNPHSVNSICDALEKIVFDKQLNNRIVQRGLERVNKFSWEKTAGETLRVYRQFLKA